MLPSHTHTHEHLQTSGTGGIFAALVAWRSFAVLKGDRDAVCGHTALLFSRPALALSSRCTSAMENIDALLQSKVKVDTATNKGSVIGLLEVLTGQTRSNCHNIFQRLTTTNPEVSTKCRRLKINGRGYEEPVADAATLVEIVFVVGSCCFLLEMRKSASLHQRCMTSRLPAAVRREEGQELQEGSCGDPVPSPARGPDSGGRDPAAPCRGPGHRPGDFPGGAGGGSRRGNGHPGKGRRRSSLRPPCVSSSAFPSDRFLICAVPRRMLPQTFSRL